MDRGNGRLRRRRAGGGFPERAAGPATDPSRPGRVHLGRPDDPQPRLTFRPVTEPRQGTVRLHLDVAADVMDQGIAQVVDATDHPAPGYGTAPTRPLTDAPHR
ncbi:VOC family protein [Actinacidiphila yanglinensis]|uniref:VOC family protein n=1 Tax=Actinacidiphila yanglinensis TaxID=310779 RepID=UPI002AFEB683|nr:VOC family protein [Actinacidiphila yanglinensis]